MIPWPLFLRRRPTASGRVSIQNTSALFVQAISNGSLIKNAGVPRAPLSIHRISSIFGRPLAMIMTRATLRPSTVGPGACQSICSRSLRTRRSCSIVRRAERFCADRASGCGGSRCFIDHRSPCHRPAPRSLAPSLPLLPSAPYPRSLLRQPFTPELASSSNALLGYWP
jgi:hypothetical protein